MSEPQSKSRNRSPEYPAKSLREALDMVSQIYSSDKGNPVPSEIAAKKIGYSGLNGASRTALSALKKFGLVDYRGGDVVVSDLAMQFLLPKSQQEKAEGVREMLTLPKMYASLLEKYPRWSLPADDTLRAILVRDFKFNSSAVDGFLKDLRESISYVEQVEREAGLSTVQTGDDDQEQDSEPFEERRTHSSNTLVSAPGLIPLRMPNRDYSLLIPQNLTPEDASEIIEWLDVVVKPYLSFAASSSRAKNEG